MIASRPSGRRQTPARRRELKGLRKSAMLGVATIPDFVHRKLAQGLEPSPEEAQAGCAAIAAAAAELKARALAARRNESACLGGADDDA